MTRNRSTTENEDRMRDVNHTNPYTNESMGSLFEHGVTVVADGGRRDAADADGEREADDERDVDADAPVDEEGDAETETRMKDVSHEAPEGGHGNRMFERVGDTADVTEE